MPNPHHKIISIEHKNSHRL